MNEPHEPPLESLPVLPALLELLESPKSRESLELLTIPEAAALLRIKASTVRAWVLHRKIEFCRVGRCVRIPRPALDEFVRRNTVARL